jgi:hypothetical protein
VLDASTLLDEAELAVERDRGSVVRENAETQLVQAALARPLDRRFEEGRAHAAPAPLARYRHSDLAEPERASLEVQRRDELVVGDRDQHPVKGPACGARLDVDRRLCGDSVTFLGDGGVENRKREAIVLARGPDLELQIGHLQSFAGFGSWRSPRQNPFVSRFYRVVAIVAATLSLLVNFGIVDLIDGLTGAFTNDTNWVLDAGWGTLFGVLIPVGLLASLRTAAGVWQIALVTVAIAVAALAGEAWRWFILVAILAAFVALSPRRSAAVRLRPSWPPAAIAVIPCALYAERAASAQRRHAPPSDAVSNGFHHWTALGALAIAVVLLALGPKLLALSAAVAAAVWAVACLLHPSADGSEGRGWAIAALAWAAALALSQFRRKNIRRPRASFL